MVTIADRLAEAGLLIRLPRDMLIPTELGRTTFERLADGSRARLARYVERWAPEQRDEVFQRGARLDESAPGSGLGLSIVDELVRAYGGQVTLADSYLGGLRVEIVLPRVEV